MKVEYRDLGRKAYKECWEYQQSLFDALLARKGSTDDAAGYLLLVEHPAVYTLGKSGHAENMLVSEDVLRSRGAEYYHIDRGGDITFHGEGQIVGYPILDLEKIGIGLKRYIESLEEAVIRTVAAYGIAAGRVAGASGVWIDDGASAPRKICAMGVRASRFVTMHGFALNVSTDLGWFSYINPCGFADRGVTSIEREIGRSVALDEVKELLVRNLSEILNVKIYKN
ncbi:MAG: lipoyl(octanoyl) transferase LipB [Alistipes sp.]